MGSDAVVYESSALDAANIIDDARLLALIDAWPSLSEDAKVAIIAALDRGMVSE